MSIEIAVTGFSPVINLHLQSIDGYGLLMFFNSSSYVSAELYLNNVFPESK